MSRTWSGGAGAAWLILLVMMFVALPARPTPAVPPPDQPSPEYLVVSKDVPGRGGTVPVPVPLDPLRAVPEKLALVMVGGLLLGLAAAVRRTT